MEVEAADDGVLVKILVRCGVEQCLSLIHI